MKIKDMVSPSCEDNAIAAMTGIDLIWLGTASRVPDWPYGKVYPVEATPAAIAHCVQEILADSTAGVCLFWDSAIIPPNTERLMEILTFPGDLWHAGLCLGMGGQPALIDTVACTGMFNCDPPVTHAATSWRLTLRACLLPTDVLRQMGGPNPAFQTLEGASLELGHRYISRGVITRHVPELVSENCTAPAPSVPFEDAVRFIYYRYGRTWSRWALLRWFMRGDAPLHKILSAWRVISKAKQPEEPALYRRSEPNSRVDVTDERVTVLIPTVDRYPYLYTLLEQLRALSISPLEIIIIDQTEASKRDTGLTEKFADLPLRVLYQEIAGQCTSRNAGLQIAQGDYILFIDDDDEVASTLIEDHLKTLYRFRAEVSSGVAEEVDAGPLPSDFRFLRASNVFPTNNTMIRREVLIRSGLFDLAYNRGQRADGDLGMRIYLSGALMVLNPEISVFHHHAPSGGLRKHKARTITYASSRNSLWQRQLPSVTEIYLAHRYFTSSQRLEMLWLKGLGTFSIRGGKLRKILKLIISFVCLPNTIREIRHRSAQAAEMLHKYPSIPSLVLSSYNLSDNLSVIDSK